MNLSGVITSIPSACPIRSLINPTLATFKSSASFPSSSVQLRFVSVTLPAATGPATAKHARSMGWDDPPRNSTTISSSPPRPRFLKTFSSTLFNCSSNTASRLLVPPMSPARIMIQLPELPEVFPDPAIDRSEPKRPRPWPPANFCSTGGPPVAQRRDTGKPPVLLQTDPPPTSMPGILPPAVKRPKRGERENRRQVRDTGILPVQEQNEVSESDTTSLQSPARPRGPCHDRRPRPASLQNFFYNGSLPESPVSSRRSAASRSSRNRRARSWDW